MRPFAAAPSAVLLASALLLPASSAPDPSDVGEARLRWRGEDTTLAELPTEVFERICPTLEHWVPWTEAEGYRAYLDAGARVVFLTHASEKRAARQLELVEETVAAFDELLPPVARDPAEEFLEADWGVGEVVPDRDPVVLFELEEPEHFASLLDHLGREVPRLSAWASGMKRGTGFMYDDVLSAAWMEAPPEVELGTVWRAENELVNRLARMLLRARFGGQPHWFKLGVAWRVEREVMGDIYAFPGRDEFVEVGSHAGWEAELKKEFKKRRRDPLRWSEFALWRDGTWDAAAAARAWGLVDLLARQDPDSLPRIAEALRREHKSGTRVLHADGRWELRPAFVVPLERQMEIFGEHAGEDLLERATVAFQKGRRYQPARR